jgi:L-alanine-DL-glutamate epimerase-like enolase superfamily enzyme
MAAQAHLNAWAPNFGIQEFLVLGSPECDALFPSEHLYESGMFHVSDGPGRGLTSTKKKQVATLISGNTTPLCASKTVRCGIIK